MEVLEFQIFKMWWVTTNEFDLVRQRWSSVFLGDCKIAKMPARKMHLLKCFTEHLGIRVLFFYSEFTKFRMYNLSAHFPIHRATKSGDRRISRNSKASIDCNYADKKNCTFQIPNLKWWQNILSETEQFRARRLQRKEDEINSLPTLSQF